MPDEEEVDGLDWAIESAKQIVDRKYPNMGVTYSHDGEYRNSVDILPPQTFIVSLKPDQSMWSKFEGKARNAQESAAYLAKLAWTQWRPQGITLHNTAAPTLAQWAESGPSHDARIRNLQNYYENELGWHAGPHWFISRTAINWFSNPLLPGVHSRCFNATRFGIEMVGDYNAEEFNSGGGALVRDLAIFWIATLNLRFGFAADDLTFHVECKQDNHDCPGRKVVKADVIARVKSAMAALASGKPDPGFAGKRFTGITATVFGGIKDPNKSAYDGHVITDTELGCALPYHFPPPLPELRAYANGKSVLVKPVDVGPWNWTDPYWEGSGIPRAVAQRANHQRADDGLVPTNDAGIDLTPAAARAIGIDGKGIVDWEFMTASPSVKRDVWWIQRAFNACGGPATQVVVNGEYDQLTISVCRQFQQAFGLVADGIAGDKQTVPALEKELAARHLTVAEGPPK